jgi:cellulose synthase/poly-beta-1,6-N-acetylglucosamine synthase-like glycosyltransferase
MAEIFGANFSVGLYVLGSLAFFLDLIDFLVRLYLRRGQTLPLSRIQVPATSVPLEIGTFTRFEARLHLRPYAILVSVHNIASELDTFLERLGPLRKRLYVIDDASTDDTWQRLETAGVACVRNPHNTQKPAAVRALLETLSPEIQTVVILDPDSRILTNHHEFERTLFEFQRSRMAALCPRILVRAGGMLGRLQRLEYALSFSLGRKSLADFTVTPGIAVYRRDALERVLAQHSLSIYAEDLENAMILLSSGERVYYDGRLLVETDAPDTMPRWFSQRVGWQFGLLRVYADHWPGLLNRARDSFGFAYQYIVYIGVFVLLFHPLKLIALPLLGISALNGLDNVAGMNVIPDSSQTNPLYFTGAYLKYTALMALAVPLTTGRYERRLVWPIVPIYTFYALLQILPSTVGYANWFSVRLLGRRVYRDHYLPASAEAAR